MSAHPRLPRITRTDPEADAGANTDTDADTDTTSAARIVHLPLLCFNDVYRVSQRYVAQSGAPKLQPASDPDAQITVAQFGQLLLSERENEETTDKDKDNGKAKEGLVLFAGDVFNPSVESAVTRGSHMVPVMNALKVDCACVGNHDFDFGFPHLTKLLESTTFPWLLSNIVDSSTGRTPAPLRRCWITERCGVRIGIIGLVEEDWIATIPSWPETFKYRPMKETALELSKELRDPRGRYRVEVVIALTHCRVPNDIRLANELGAVAGRKGVENEHGVDLLIGGHDHQIGKGADEWDGFPGERGAAGTQDDHGVRLIKSGTDFRDLTSAVLTLTPTPPGSIRRRLISSLRGTHHYVLPTSPTSPDFQALVDSLLSSVSSTLSKPVCFTLTPFDARSELVRTQETGLGNWVADVLLHAYAESGVENKGWVKKEGEKQSEKPGGQGGEDGVVGHTHGKTSSEPMGSGPTAKSRTRPRTRSRSGTSTGADAVIICGGTLRGDSQYGPGKITLGDILEILPFGDPVVCIEIDGKGIWDTMEGALSKWPAQEGLELGEEVKPVGRDQGGRVYRVITREYMALGYDGFEALKNRTYIIDDETGQIMSAIIRSFLLGSSYIFRHKQLEEQHHRHLSTRTDRVLSRARAQHQSFSRPSSLASSLTSSPRSPMTLRALSFSPGRHAGVGGLFPHEKTIPEEAIVEGEGKGTVGDTAGTGPGPGLGLGLGLSPLSLSDSMTLEPEQVERSFMSGVSGASGWDKLRRHVVKHDWATIRDALYVARHEHMSAVDECTRLNWESRRAGSRG
ncbi:hypothetical protein JCM24511_09276 [Saitozyma sp. JCM 24511]|nr:hypothetical protein JCM24511_09276 [Saitozyma sp. JCM 24511]